MKTILHADDSPRFRDLVSGELAEHFHVVSVGSGDDVLPRLKEGGIDLVILDFLMPGEDDVGTGFEVSERIREKYPALPVVVFSGAWDDPAVRARYTDAELDAMWTRYRMRFVRKASGVDSLKQAVEESLPPGQ